MEFPKVSTELNWLDSYYEALEFFYLEPQRLGCKKNPNAKLKDLKDVRRQLRRLEVTLNQTLQQFFALAPNRLRNALFAKIFGDSLDDQFIMHGRDVDKYFALDNCMQPDFVFSSDRQVVSLEMKTASKSSLDQVLKYALLGLAVEQKQGREKMHYFALLGPGSLSQQFAGHFDNEEELMAAVNACDLSKFLQNKPERFRSQETRFKEIVGGISVGYLNYGHFAEFLSGELASAQSDSASSEVYRNLLNAMIKELEDRKLTRK